MEITFVNVDQLKAERCIRHELKMYTEQQRQANLYAEKTEAELNAVVALLMLSRGGKQQSTPTPVPLAPEKPKSNYTPKRAIHAEKRLMKDELPHEYYDQLRAQQQQQQQHNHHRNQQRHYQPLIMMGNNNGSKKAKLAKEEQQHSKPSLLVSCRNMLKDFLKTVDTGRDCGSL